MRRNVVVIIDVRCAWFGCDEIRDPPSAVLEAVAVALGVTNDKSGRAEIPNLMFMVVPQSVADTHNDKGETIFINTKTSLGRKIDRVYRYSGYHNMIDTALYHG